MFQHHCLLKKTILVRESLLSSSNKQTTLSVKAPPGSNELDHLSLKIDLLTKSVDKMTYLISEKRGINEFGPFVLEKRILKSH